MASEPRNYPDYVFVAYDEDFSAQTYDIAVSLEPGNLVGRPVKYIRHDFNIRPAPAATDTGLVTVAYAGPNGLSPVKPLLFKSQTRELCDRSQAEELLAAERAAHDNTIATLSSLTEDNAALTARVKELAEALDKQRELDNESTLHHYNRAKALETQLAAAKKALEPFVSFFNVAMNGFTDGYADREPSDKQVLWWNNGYLTMRHFLEARAVLGGKPS